MTEAYSWAVVKYMIYGSTLMLMAFSVSKCTGSVS